MLPRVQPTPHPAAARVLSASGFALLVAEYGTSQYGLQAAAWLAYIKWEESNPQGLDEEHLLGRTTVAVDQALGCLTFLPEVWIHAVLWNSERGTQQHADRAIELLKEA